MGEGWLVLARRCGDVVRIGDVVIQIRNIAGGEVKLAINAPPEIPVDRGENASANADGLLTRRFSGRLPASCGG